MLQRRLFLFCVSYLIGNFCLRLYISESLNFDASDLSIWKWLAALNIGLFNDLIVVGFILALVQCFSQVFPGQPQNKIRIHALCISMILFGLISLVQIIVDIFFWYEFQSRGNRLILHYLKYPKEIVSFLHEQLLLWYWAVPLIIAILFLYKYFYQYLKPSIQTYYNKPWKTGLSIAYLITAYIAVGQFKMLEPFQSRLLNQFSGNAIVNLIHISQIDITNWDNGYPSLSSREIEQILAQDSNKKERYVAPIKGIKHVIIIVEESFAGRSWSDPAQRQESMPNLVRWADQGILFDNIFATGTRTVRGLAAILHATAPLPGIAVNQRPVINQLPALPQTFKQQGFETWFVYGGWPNFSNFSKYWRASGYDNIQTKEDFDSSLYQTSWGVADEFLFERIIEVMDKQSVNDQSIFLSTLTVSNHRPFDVPEDRLTFAQKRVLKNGLRYADFALGEFLDKASAKPWFDDSLIVVVADHGPRIYGQATIPANSFHVPLLFIAPKHLLLSNHQYQHQLGSVRDIPKTLLNLLDIPSDEFEGNDLFVNNNQRYALVEYDYHIGILKPNNQLSVIPYKGKPETWLLQPVSKSTGADSSTKTVTDNNAIRQLNAIMQQAHERLYR